MKNKIISFFAGIVISIYSFGASAVTEVVWWDFLGGGDGVRMKQLIDNFNSAIILNNSSTRWTKIFLFFTNEIRTEQLLCIYRDQIGHE